MTHKPADGERSKLEQLRDAYKHYLAVQDVHGHSVYIKENGRNNRSPHCELMEAVYDVLYCDTDQAKSEAALTAAAEQLREKDEELKRLSERLAAGVKFYTLSHDGGSGIEICKIHAGWNVYITHYGDFGPRDGRHGLFESLDEAWNALVAANWLPQPEQQGGG